MSWSLSFHKASRSEALAAIDAEAANMPEAHAALARAALGRVPDGVDVQFTGYGGMVSADAAAIGEDCTINVRHKPVPKSAPAVPAQESPA